MIRDENGQLAGYVYVDTATRDIGGYVARAREAVAATLTLPHGYTLQWTGQYEFQVRARERLRILLPIVFAVIFLLLYMTFHSASEAVIVMLSVVYAMTGGVVYAVPARLQLLGRGLGRLHRPLRHRRRDRRRDGRLPPRGARRAARARRARHRARHLGGDHRGIDPAPAAQADDRGDDRARAGADHVEHRRRLRPDEADRRADRRRHDHLDDPRPDRDAGDLLRAEGARAPARHAAPSRHDPGPDVPESRQPPENGPKTAHLAWHDRWKDRRHANTATELVLRADRGDRRGRHPVRRDRRLHHRRRAGAARRRGAGPGAAGAAAAAAGRPSRPPSSPTPSSRPTATSSPATRRT